MNAKTNSKPPKQAGAGAVKYRFQGLPVHCPLQAQWRQQTCTAGPFHVLCPTKLLLGLLICPFTSCLAPSSWGKTIHFTHTHPARNKHGTLHTCRSKLLLSEEDHVVRMAGVLALLRLSPATYLVQATGRIPKLDQAQGLGRGHKNRDSREAGSESESRMQYTRREGPRPEDHARVPPPSCHVMRHRQLQVHFPHT